MSNGTSARLALPTRVQQPSFFHLYAVCGVTNPLATQDTQPLLWRPLHLAGAFPVPGSLPTLPPFALSGTLTTRFPLSSHFVFVPSDHTSLLALGVPGI